VPAVRTLLSLLSRQEKRGLAAVLGLIVVTSALEAMAVAAIYPFLAVVASPGTLSQNRVVAFAYVASHATTPRSFLVVLGVVILGLVLLTSLVGAYTMWRQQRFVWSFEHQLQVRLLTRYLSQAYPYFIEHNTADIQRALTREAMEICEGVLEPGMELIARGVVALAIFAVLLLMQPVIAIAAGVVLGGAYMAIWAAGRVRLRFAGMRAREAKKASTKTVGDAFGAIKYVKASFQERSFLHRFDEAERVVAREYAKSALYARLPRFVIEGVTFAFIMALFIFVLGSGADLLNVLPALGLFAFAGFRLLPALHGVVQSAARIRFNDQTVQEVALEVAEAQRLHLADPDAAERVAIHRDLRLEHVAFRYPGQTRDVLVDVNVTFPRNTSIAIVGRTGAGKTTLLDILLGLLEPTSGRVLVDGLPIGPERRAGWAKTIAYVPQQTVLLDDTITRNIAFGVPDERIDRARVEAVAQMASVHDLIVKEFAEGYATVVGERGVRLSGGQRQRIGIARALYRDPEILVLDEATSEVDTLTERHINDAIRALAGKKTVIVVAHRFSAVRACDRVLFLEDGKVAAFGTFDEVLATSSAFRAMAEA
jgi:ABC-type multidrug transport system fused ATPase/permease subunit